METPKFKLKDKVIVRGCGVKPTEEVSIVWVGRRWCQVKRASGIEVPFKFDIHTGKSEGGTVYLLTPEEYQAKLERGYFD